MHRFLLTLALLPLAAFAQPGTLDPAFGNGGTVFLTPNPRAGANAVAAAADGKLLLAGTVGEDAAVLRLNADGSLDTGFGDDGYALVDLGGGEDQFVGLAVQPDGRIVVSGIGEEEDNEAVGVVARLTADGALDASFGSGGVTVVSEGFESSQFTRLVLRPDGTILAVGTASPQGGGPNVAIVARFEAGGELDPAFGIGGVARVSSDGILLFGQGIDVQADGQIAIGGVSSQNGLTNEGFAARLTPSGTLDEEFGLRYFFFFGEDYSGVTDVLVDRAGRSVLVGYAGDPFSGRLSLVLARLAPDGSFDASFGEGGRLRTTLGTAVAQGISVAEQTDGKLLAIGPAGPDGATADLTLARFLEDGTLDDAFGEGGVASADLAEIDIATDVVLQPDGYVVVAGYANTIGGTPVGIEVARFENDKQVATEPSVAPAALLLGAPYPNPTAGAAWLPVEAPPGVAVRVEVFDRLGRRVAVLHDGLATGAPLRLDLSGLASGAYAVRAVAGGSTATRWVIRP